MHDPPPAAVEPVEWRVVRDMDARSADRGRRTVDWRVVRDSDARSASRRPPPALGERPASGLADVGALDHERESHVGSVLVEVLPPDPRADDVHGADVAK